MNDLLRELAPISDAAWGEIEAEARRTLKLTLAARKLVDFSGPHGWAFSAVDLGRVEAIAPPPGKRLEARRRRVQPLVELRVPFEMARAEVETIGRGGKDGDVHPVTLAARTLAIAEDWAIFHGHPGGGITGIAEAAKGYGLKLSDDFARYPRVLAEALNKLRNAGVAGPYGIALGPRCYTGLTETATPAGYRVFDHVQRLLDGGPVVWAPGVDGAVVVSLRGGDFELTVGQDISIGYLGHDAASVTLYLQESFTFRVITPEAAVPLFHTATKSRTQADA
jgi:uncharacterized linocin/CFP29 family protein